MYIRIAAVMAMVASSMLCSQPAQSEMTGTKTHARAASRKMVPAVFSARDIAPIFSSSSWMSSRPPGIWSISGLNTVISTSQASTMNTAAIGTPTSIHWPKPMWMSWDSCR